ncbi:hypothetical protein [Streptomyces chattanoogensis]|uniref:Lipoprotein n=1 Tax=Streptomyces chattanoogensis TaxID=66876 RepID=A0A0N0XSE5_9ACTN|nr:hypothetical protein [Streptomyces chattanoogensis]KPC60614.1 hypothetical protein ADL29_28890 [Streptomyces chattanoogensis]
MKKKVLLIVAVCVAVCVAAAAPLLKKYDDHLPDAVNDHLFHERIKTFATAGDAPESGDGEGLFVLPPWVPKDVTHITEKVQTDGSARLMRFTLDRAPLKLSGPKGCTGGAFNAAPALDASWWPEDVGEGAGRVDCSYEFQWRVAVKGKQVYAWTNGDRLDD